MRVVITGGAGEMAKGVLFDVMQQKDVSEILLADFLEKRVKERVAVLNDKRLVAKFVDLTDEEKTVALFKGAAVVINTARQDTIMNATRAAAKAGVNYVDLGSIFDIEGQLALHEEFKKKGVTAIPGVGTAPGASSIIASYLVDKLDRVESIHLKAGCVDLNDKEHTRPLYWSYDISTILDEFEGEAIAFLNGKSTRVPGMSGEEIYTFHEKMGPVAIGYTLHPEPVTMPLAFKDKGIKNVTWKIGFTPSFTQKLRFLCDLGFNSPKPINVKGQMVAPKDVLLELLNNHQPDEKLKKPEVRVELVVIAVGEEKGQRVEYTMSLYPSEETIEAMRIIDFLKDKQVFFSPRVGIYAAIASMILARGQQKGKGVLPAEKCIPAELFLQEASKRGHVVELLRKVLL